MERERSRVHVQGSPTRCAYCHDSVEVEERTACKACVAVHHIDCWRQDRCCAACGSTLSFRTEASADLDALSDRTAQITTFALCGFANIGAVGIQLGGIGSLAPDRRGDLARLAFRALYGGFVATLLNAAIAGLLIR